MKAVKKLTSLDLLLQKVKALAATATSKDILAANQIVFGASSTDTVITPVIAAVILVKTNTQNRDISMANVYKCAGAMARGEWILNNQGIGFTDDGKLADGQHRLYGCVQSNTPINTPISTHLPAEVVDTIDQGVFRSLAATLKLKGHSDATIKATMSKRYMDYRDKLGGRTHTAYTLTQGEEFVVRHADELELGVGITDDIQKPVSSQQPLKKSEVASIVFTMVSLGADPDKVREFMRAVQTGVTDGQGQEASVVIVLSRNFGKARFSNRTDERLSAIQKTVLAIKGFNLWSEGKKIARLGWSKKEGYPSVKFAI